MARSKSTGTPSDERLMGFLQRLYKMAVVENVRKLVVFPSLSSAAKTANVSKYWATGLVREGIVWRGTDGTARPWKWIAGAPTKKMVGRLISLHRVACLGRDNGNPPHKTAQRQSHSRKPLARKKPVQTSLPLRVPRKAKRPTRTTARLQTAHGLFEIRLSVHLIK